MLGEGKAEYLQKEACGRDYAVGLGLCGLRDQAFPAQGSSDLDCSSVGAELVPRQSVDVKASQHKGREDLLWPTYL